MDFRLAQQVERVARSRGYDAVISLSERVGIPLSYALDRQIKHIVIMHHPLSPAKLRLLRKLRIPQRWDLTIAISHAEAAALRDALDLAPERIAVLHTPVDTRFFQPDRAAPAPDAPDYVQSLGLSYRDYPTLIRAMRMLPHIDCYLRAGSTWVQGRAGHEREALPANIHIKPYVHPSVLRDCYTQSRFIIVPLRQTTQWSAGCTSVQQAQAMGKAVIATRLLGLSDYVLDNETGILVEGGNPDALAQAISDLWNDPARVAAMGRRASDWIRTTFSLDRWLDDLATKVYSLDHAGGYKELVYGESRS
jgi:glycosyltransferase involved in cell wall biosynthesis